MKSRAKWIWFANICGVASTEMIKIYEKFGSINEVYLADYDKYIVEGVSERLAERLSDKSLTDAYSTVKFCQDNGGEYSVIVTKRIPIASARSRILPQSCIISESFPTSIQISVSRWSERER